MHTWIGKILKDEYRTGTTLKDMEITDEPLAVLSFAKMNYDEDTEYFVLPNGRKDYQFIYVKEGRFENLEGDKYVTYGKNTMFLFKPGIPITRRILCENGRSVFFYVHFSGNKVEEILEKYNITDTVVTFDEKFDAFEEIINRMEAGKKSDYHQSLCNLLLQELFILISDNINQKTSNTMAGFSRILNLMDETCTKNYPVKFYADQIHFTEVYFIRFFKKAMGVPPHKYLMTKKLEKATPLLLYSNDSIKTISEKLGFSTQHYFSKVFTDKYKLSPSEYRNIKKQKNKKANEP